MPFPCAATYASAAAMSPSRVQSPSTGVVKNNKAVKPSTALIPGLKDNMMKIELF